MAPPHRRGHSPTPGATGTAGGPLTVAPGPLVPPASRQEAPARSAGEAPGPRGLCPASGRGRRGRTGGPPAGSSGGRPRHSAPDRSPGEARMSGGDETKQRAVRPTRNAGAERPALPGGGLDRTVQPPATCHYRALETGLPRNEPGYHCKCTPDPRLRT